MSSKPAIKKRLFLVGTARSGTTLLQSMLSAHPDIFSFPETHFFRGTMSFIRYKRIFKCFGKNERAFVREFLTRLNETDLVELLPNFTCSKRRWSKALISILDAYALKQGYSIWLEKTPMHLYFIDLIQAVKPDTVFIHNIRNGEDVVASLYDAGHKHPESFNTRSIDKCIRRWLREIRISKKYLASPNHVFVRYELLVDEPEKQLKKVCEKIGLPFDPGMLDYRRKADTLRFPEEVWKDRNTEEIKKVRKFETLFSKEEQEYIRSRVAPVEMNIFN